MPHIAQIMDADELARAIGQNIRLARVGKRWPQEELCARSGVSLQALKNLESGRNAEMKTFLRVAKALGMVEHILANTEPHPNTLDQLERVELARMSSVRVRQSTPRRSLQT